MEGLCKRFTVGWLALSCAGLCAIAAFNILVDPSGAYLGAHLKAFEPYRYLNHDRPHKAELARRGDWEVIILGSSRPKAGFPAAYPYFQTNRTCNLSVDGARFVELSRAFDFTRARNPVRQILLGVDVFMFSGDSRWMENFAESRFNPDFDRFTYFCKQLLGRASTDESCAALLRAVKGERPPPQSQLGFFEHEIPPGTSQRALFDRVLRFMGNAYQAQKVDPAQLELFREFVRTCRDQNIDLQIAIMPVHALDLELLFEGGRWDEFESWKAGVVTVLADEGVEGKFRLWDFSGYRGPTTETIPAPGDTTSRMKYYFENSHCTPALGKYILDAMLSGTTNPPSVDGQPFGMVLTRSNLAPHLRDIRADREVYLREHPVERDWMRTVVAAPPQKSL
jgi:hypothetical protein